MTTTLMLLWLLGSKIEQKDILLQEAPQVVCPTSLEAYASVFLPWARKEIIERQFLLAVISNEELFRRKI